MLEWNSFYNTFLPGTKTLSHGSCFKTTENNKKAK